MISKKAYECECVRVVADSHVLHLQYSESRSQRTVRLSATHLRGERRDSSRSRRSTRSPCARVTDRSSCCRCRRLSAAAPGAAAARPTGTGGPRAPAAAADSPSAPSPSPSSRSDGSRAARERQRNDRSDALQYLILH